MESLIALWDSEFVVSLFRDNIVPVFVGGFFLGGMFWIVGYVVEFLLAVVRGSSVISR